MTCDICTIRNSKYRFHSGYSYCQECLSNQPANIAEAQKTIVELELKSCTLDLTKGHLSQCEEALEERDKQIDDLQAKIEGKNKDIDMLTALLSDVYQSGVKLDELEEPVHFALSEYDYSDKEKGND